MVERKREREEFSVNLKTDLSVEARKIFITLFLIEFSNAFATRDFSAAAPKVCAVIASDRVYASLQSSMR